MPNDRNWDEHPATPGQTQSLNDPNCPL